MAEVKHVKLGPIDYTSNFDGSRHVGVDFGSGNDRTVVTITVPSSKSRVSDAIAYLRAKYPGAEIVVRGPDAGQ